jgi:hypothetical protein
VGFNSWTHLHWLSTFILTAAAEIRSVWDNPVLVPPWPSQYQMLVSTQALFWQLTILQIQTTKKVLCFVFFQIKVYWLSFKQQLENNSTDFDCCQLSCQSYPQLRKWGQQKRGSSKSFNDWQMPIGCLAEVSPLLTVVSSTSKTDVAVTRVAKVGSNI